MASDDWPDERARATAVLGAQGLEEPGAGRAYNRQIHDRADPNAWDREAGPRRRGLLMPVAASLVVLAAFVGAVWYAYNWGLEDGSRMEIPLVEAEDAPLKVKPEDPGGLKVPNQDSLVMNQGARDDRPIEVERLLPEPETPQPLVPLESPAPPAAESLPAGAVPPEGEGAEPDTPAEAGARLADAPLPASGQSDVDQSQAGRATSAPAADRAASEPAKPPPAARAPAAIQVSELKAGDTVIQLASVASDAAAEREWGRLQKAFPDLLGDMELAIQKVTVKGKEYHRMQTGPFPTRATAQEMCALLKSKKQACLVTKR